jgi:hypothetical protein
MRWGRIRVVMSALALAACTDQLATGQDSGMDATTDTSADVGAADASDASDVGTADAGFDAAPTDSSSSKDGSSIFGDAECKAPTDCTSGFCCGTIVLTGAFPPCKLEDASSVCASTCNSSIAGMCNATDTIRLCAAANDCLDAGSGYTNCCKVPFSATVSATFCWNTMTASFVGGSCL